MHSDTTSETPKPTTHAASFLARAKSLLQKTSLAVVPLAAVVVATDAEAQPSMTSDYSVVGSQTSSGWFTGALALDDANAASTSSGNHSSLSGARSITDGIFWNPPNDYTPYTTPGYDTTGLRYVWGGTLNGGVLAGDTLSALINFNVTFNHTSAGEFDTPYVNYYLTLGYRTSVYTPELYQRGPDGSAYNYHQEGDSFYAAGSFDVTKALSTNFYSDILAEEPLYWFVQLDVQWNHEFVSARNWSYPNYSKLNGDALTVTIPEGFSAVSFNSTAVSAIPEPAHFAGIFGVMAVGLLCWRQRSRKLAS